MDQGYAVAACGSRFVKNAASASRSCLRMIARYLVKFRRTMFPQILGNPEGLPVAVYVHGGAFHSGSSNSELYAPDYLMDHDVILVTLNYRLGVLGETKDRRARPKTTTLRDLLFFLPQRDAQSLFLFRSSFSL